TQIWIAVSVYVLVAIIRKRLKLEQSLYTILQILSLTMFEKTLLNQLFEPESLQFEPPENANQLNLFP
ncbi:MAG: IS4 family transposase, partial [Gammaproteobacteria bacterium]|nr:IS4 family transposase [Gammaproteobacteria bacterium]